MCAEEEEVLSPLYAILCTAAVQWLLYSTARCAPVTCGSVLSGCWYSEDVLTEAPTAATPSIRADIKMVVQNTCPKDIPEDSETVDIGQENGGEEMNGRVGQERERSGPPSEHSDEDPEETDLIR